MTGLYLWLNAALYATFAVWCSLLATQTSQSLGYTALNSSGRSEYLTVYGGLQLGLALFFAWVAYRPEMHRTGLVLALAIYLPLVIMRWMSIARYWPVERLTLGVGTLEFIMLVIAVWLWYQSRLAAVSA